MWGVMPQRLHIAEGLVWLNSQKTQEYLDYSFWMKLHKKLFGDVWNWAGKVRTHELSNPDFLEYHEIWTALRILEQDSKFWIENDTYSKHEIMTRIHERLLTIHPFPNGNGRFSRIMIDYMCKRLLLPPPMWGSHLQSQPKSRRKEYIQAIEEGRRDFSFKRLESFIFD